MGLARLIASMGCVAALSLSVGTCLAQTYPTAPIKMIVPYPPGGGADVAGRVIGHALGERLGQQIVIENRPGASGRIGTQLAAIAPADGYTLLLGNVGPNAIIPGSYPKLPYDQEKNFAPISLVASTDYMLVVSPAMPVHSVEDLVALAKKSPGKISFGSTGVLTGPHLAGELLKVLTQIDMLHVPYRGGGAAASGILSGEIDLNFASAPTVVPHIQAGRLRAVATTGLRRTDAVANLPTIGETLPGYEVSQWYGVLAPAGTPSEIVARLHREIVAVTRLPKVQAQLEKAGAIAVASESPEEFARYIRGEMTKWGDVVRRSGVPLE